MKDHPKPDEEKEELREPHQHDDVEQHHRERPGRFRARFGRFSILKMYLILCGIVANLYVLFLLIGRLILNMTAS